MVQDRAIVKVADQ